MMKQILYITTLLLLIIFGTACEKDIDISIPEDDQVIVVNSMFQAGNLVEVSLSKSQPIKNINPLKVIDDATVVLFENGIQVDTLVRDIAGHYFSTRQAEVGKEYRVEIAAPTLTSVSSQATIPEKPVIDRVLIDTIQSEEFLRELLIRISIDDRPEANWYNLKLYTQYIDPETDSIVQQRVINYQPYNDPILEGLFWDEAQGASFEDVVFNGAMGQISVTVEEFELLATFGESYDVQVLIELKSITRDNYRYNVAYSRWMEADGNPFAEPVKIPTNIENGLGIFAGYSTDTFQFPVSL